MNKRKTLHALIYFVLNDISDKFDAHALKSFVDNVFVLSEKIIVDFPRFFHAYIEYYSDIIDKEIQVASITNDSSVLHIGCGSIPASSFLIARNTGAQVSGVDTDNKAIKKAKTCIQHRGYEEYIDVSFKDALEMDLSAYSIILISQGIKPKQRFLTALSKNITGDHIIILRSFSQDGSLDSSDQFLLELYHIVDIISHTIHGSTISIIMKKK